MKTIAIICPRENVLFNDLASALCISFMELGWFSIRLGTREEIRSHHIHALEYAFIITPFDYPDIKRLLPNTKLMLYQTEVLPWINRLGYIQSWLGHKYDDKWRRLRPLLSNYDIIFDYDKINIEHNLKYSCANKKVGFLPVGYSSLFELDDVVPSVSKVLFIGHVSNRRQHILTSTQRNDYDLQWINNAYQKDAVKLMKGAAINLNLHSFDLSTFESTRIVQQLFSNHAFVISEICTSAPEFKDSIHWGTADYRFFPDMIRHYLRQPDRRLQIAENAYNYVVQHYTMTMLLEQALKECGVE